MPNKNGDFLKFISSKRKGAPTLWQGRRFNYSEVKPNFLLADQEKYFSIEFFSLFK